MFDSLSYKKFKQFTVKTVNFIRHETDQKRRKNCRKSWVCYIEKHI